MLCKICKDYGEAGFEWSEYKLKEINKKAYRKTFDIYTTYEGIVES